MASVNVTVNMPPEMLDDIDDEAEIFDMSRAQYIRHCVRQAPDSRFECPDRVSDDTGVENTDSSVENQEGAA